MTILKLPHLSQDKYDAIRDLILDKAPQAVTFMVYSPTLQIGVFYFIGGREYIPQSLLPHDLGLHLRGDIDHKNKHEFIAGFAELTADYIKKEAPPIIEAPKPIEISPPPDPISPNPSPPIDLSKLNKAQRRALREAEEAARRAAEAADQEAETFESLADKLENPEEPSE